MNIKKLIVLCSLGLSNSLMFFCCFAHSSEKDQNESVEEKKSSEGAATPATDPKEGIKLSTVAQKTLGITVSGIDTKSVHHTSKTALVYFQDKVGVYRLRNLYFKLIDIAVVSKTDTEVTFKSDEITQGDQVVTGGVALLRVADLDASGGSGEGD